MKKAILLAILFSITHAAYADPYESLYKDDINLTYDDLVMDVRGYKVPTRAAFRGWVIMNNAQEKVDKIGRQLLEAGVKVEETMPLHLVLLQGTDWVLNGTSVFTMPREKHVQSMINTILFIQKFVEPEIGVVIPVSGERTTYYNQTAGGAARSKHMDFCALDLVPAEDISRAELHKKLKEIYRKVGKEHKMGLGLYSGVRFHIDTCGYRNW